MRSRLWIRPVLAAVAAVALAGCGLGDPGAADGTAGEKAGGQPSRERTAHG